MQEVPGGPQTGDWGQLAGLKVVEFAHVVAGPLAGSLLADMGADVVHVEPPGSGDAARGMGPERDGVRLWFKVSGRNKRSVTLDLRTAAGREVAASLVEWADVVIVTFRASRLEEWGLDREAIRARNPRAVVLQISGFGANTSKADAPGFGKMGEARSGVVHLTGAADGPPVHTGFSHGDAVTGLMGSHAVLAALYRRERDPEAGGEWIDLALFESLFRLVEWQIIAYDQLGEVPMRQGNQLAVAPAAVIDTYLSADGEWITVTSATRRSVLNVVSLLGLPGEEYSTVERQIEGRHRIGEALRQWIAARDADDALALLAAADVVASRIFTAKDIVEDPIYAERDDIVTIEDPDLGPVRMQGVVPRFGERPGKVWRTGPALGEDNETVYGDWLGMDRERLEELRDAGAI
ncbi:CoA transferase [Nocardiopsis sp. CT-R113]|uniref:CoA transferase n=1 Tax=Nocardiopsis codii TaxID=3065942 RepID=A0ABU7KFA4_9ACTN|nr:CoA transferase [Nocardiopsis sp. CT-R113]MEE2040687.1 CoA transferase [Nocardiopsis sp. CT-R113]